MACPTNWSCSTIAGQCDIGTPTSDNNSNSCGTSRTWSCVGTNWWSTSSCSITNPACPVNCVWSFWSCSLFCGWGIQTYSITTPAANWWIACSNANWDTQACNTQACSSNWSCGPANWTTVASIPTSNLCAWGSASVATLIWNQYIWSCDWANGWTSSSCFANAAPSCDTVNAWSCTLGTAWSDNSVSCGTRTWTCTNWWQTVSCTKPLVACNYICTWTPWLNTTLCANDDQWLTIDTPINLSLSCTSSSKCEYVCGSGYTYDSLSHQCEMMHSSSPILSNWISWTIYISWTTNIISNVNTYLYSGSVISSNVSNWSNWFYAYIWILPWNYRIGIGLPDGYDWFTYSSILSLIGDTYLSYNFYLTHCGGLEEKSCSQNNCANPLCTNWCDVWLTNTNGICKKTSSGCVWWCGWTSLSKSMYCRDKQEIYLYISEVRSTDMTWPCPIATAEYITICRDGQNIQALKDYNYLKWLVKAGDSMWACILEPKLVDIKKYLTLYHEAAPMVLEPKVLLPATGVDLFKIQESYRK